MSVDTRRLRRLSLSSSEQGEELVFSFSVTLKATPDRPMTSAAEEEQVMDSQSVARRAASAQAGRLVDEAAKGQEQRGAGFPALVGGERRRAYPSCTWPRQGQARRRS